MRFSFSIKSISTAYVGSLRGFMCHRWLCLVSFCCGHLLSYLCFYVSYELSGLHIVSDDCIKSTAQSALQNTSCSCKITSVVSNGDREYHANRLLADSGQVQ